MLQGILSGHALVPAFADDIHHLSPTSNDLLALGSCRCSVKQFKLSRIYFCEICLNQWRYASNLAKFLWRKWFRKYIPPLEARQIWIHIKGHFKAGDAVMVPEDHFKVSSFPLGVLKWVITSSDGLVRPGKH